MDLSSCKSNLKSNKYNSVDECLNDLKLIWYNCKIYNMEGSEIWKLANTMEKTSNKIIEKVFKSGIKDNKSGINNSKSVTNSIKTKDEESLRENYNNDEEQTEETKKNSLNLQEKINLTEKVRKLSNEGLSAFVRLVQKECPNAFEDLDAEKVQVRVDFLDRDTYSQLLVLVDHYLKQV
jgi:hypothetical protein